MAFQSRVSWKIDSDWEQKDRNDDSRFKTDGQKLSMIVVAIVGFTHKRIPLMSPTGELKIHLDAHD